MSALSKVPGAVEILEKVTRAYGSTKQPDKYWKKALVQGEVGKMAAWILREREKGVVGKLGDMFQDPQMSRQAYP